MFYYHPIFKKLSDSIIWENYGNSLTLTFDDGPQSAATETALSVLSKYSIKAVFFFLGTSLKRNPQLGKDVVHEGHLVGNHSTSHRILPLMRYEAMLKDILECDHLIKDTLGVESVAFRPPYGLFDHRVLKIVRNLNKKILMFSVDSGDYTNNKDEKLINRIRRLTRPNSIILFHDNRATLPLRRNLLDDAIQHFLEQGFSFSTGDPL